MIINPWLRDSPLTHADKSLEKGCDPGINSFLLMQPFVQLPLCRQPFYDWFSLPADSRNHHTVGFCLKKAFYSNCHIYSQDNSDLSHIQMFGCKVNKSNILRRFHQKQILAGTGFKPTTLSLLAPN